MECVNCEISLLKRNVKMNDYSKAGVEVLHHFPPIIIIHVSWHFKVQVAIAVKQLDIYFIVLVVSVSTSEFQVDVKFISSLKDPQNLLKLLISLCGEFPFTHIITVQSALHQIFNTH